MSYILQALKKSEQERARGRVPTIASVRVPGVGGPVRRRWGPVVTLVALALAVGIAAGWWWQRASGPPPGEEPVQVAPAAPRAGSGQPPAAEPPRVAVAPSPAEPPASLPGTPPSLPAPVAAPEPVPSPPSPAQAQSGVAAPPGAGTPRAEDAEAPMPSAPPAPAASAVAPDTATPAEGSGEPPEPSPVEPGKQSAGAAQDSQAADGGSDIVAPLLIELPFSYQQSVPALSINVHLFGRDPAARAVVIDMRRYHEGDTLANGVQVVSILRDGVVLEFGGIRFRLNRP